MSPYTKGYLGPSYDAVIMRDGKKLSLDEVLAALNGGAPSVLEAEIAAASFDAMAYGIGFMRDGKRIPPGEVRVLTHSEDEDGLSERDDLIHDIGRQVEIGAELATENATLTARVKALEDENAGLHKLLVPFGKEGGCWADSVKDSYHPGMSEPGKSLVFPGSRAKFTVGHLRKVRDYLVHKALSSNKAGG